MGSTAEPEYPSRTVYSSLAAPGIDVDQLVYFGTSIFWKASVGNWTMGRKPNPLIHLGHSYEDQFRRYLHADDEFPSNAVLWIAVIRSEEPPPVISFPRGEINGKYHRHYFDLFGLSYTLYVGSSIPEEVTRFCAVRTPKRLIFFTDIGPILDRRTAELFTRSVPTRKLAQRTRNDLGLSQR